MQEEIEATCFALADRMRQLTNSGGAAPAMSILPMYSLLNAEQQALIFQPAPPGVRKASFPLFRYTQFVSSNEVEACTKGRDVFSASSLNALCQAALRMRRLAEPSLQILLFDI